MVLKRLTDLFPQQSVGLAMRPERLVRLHFTHFSGGDWTRIYGYFENVGVGPALNIIHGVSLIPIGGVTPESLPGTIREPTVYFSGGLAEGRRITNVGKDSLEYHVPGPGEQNDVVAFATYENRFGDQYLVEAPLRRDNARAAAWHRTVDREGFFVAAIARGQHTRWVKVH